VAGDGEVLGVGLLPRMVLVDDVDEDIEAGDPISQSSLTVHR
jgi:hypothetical protein